MTPAGSTRSVGRIDIGLRILTAALSTAMAGIHLYLYLEEGYSNIPTIGNLFLLDVAVGVMLAIGILISPARLLAPVAAATALFFASAVGGLVLSVNVGLFGFTESSRAPLFDQALAVEAAGIAAGLALVAHALARYKSGARSRRRALG